MQDAERQSCRKVWGSFFDQGVDERCQVAVKNNKQESVGRHSSSRTHKMEFLLCRNVLWRAQLGAGSSFHPESCKALEKSPEQRGLTEDWQAWAEKEN